jgi:acetyl esterase/lipase
VNVVAALDPQIAAIVNAQRSDGIPRAFEGGVEKARHRLKAAILAEREGVTMPEVADVRGEKAGAIPLRIYTPASAGSSATVVWFHGGGYALGDLDVFEESARRLCNELAATVVAAGYRHPPENPFPVPFDDAVAATLWAVAHAATLGGDPSRVAVAGESAGGNLAASAAIAMRDRGVPLVGQLLIVPGVNMARELPSDAVYPMLDVKDLADIRDLLMGPGANVAVFPPSPLYAVNLKGLASAVVAIAGHDPLRAEGAAYAERLSAAGVATELLSFDDMHHMFFGFARASEGANRAIKKLCAVFRKCLEADLSIQDAERSSEARR